MKSYKKINKQINNYLQALTSNESVFANVERRRIRIAKDLLTPKNKTLIQEEYEKSKEEATVFKASFVGHGKKYSLNRQLRDVIKYIGDKLSDDISKLGPNSSQVEIDKLQDEAKQQILNLKNDLGLFVTQLEEFIKIKELPLGSANSIIPEYNSSFINYVANREDKDIMIVPIPDNTGFNLVVLDKNGKISKDVGVIPLSQITKEIHNNNSIGYFEQVPDTKTLDIFYKDMDNLVASLIQTDNELFQQTGKGLFKLKEDKKEENKVPRRIDPNQPPPPRQITEEAARNFFRRTPSGKQMLYSFLEDEDLLGYYKNMQYSDYMDKKKPFTTNNYLKAIENYLVPKFEIPTPQPQEEQPQNAMM